MAKNTVVRIDRNLARRLREARKEVGLSGRAVAARLPKRLAVSHTTIANYENGIAKPPIDVLAALADIYNRPLNWFLDERESLSAFRYRNIANRVPVTEQRRFEATASKWTDAYLNLERHLKLREPRKVRLLESGDGITPEGLATLVRTTYLDLDEAQPIQSMVSVLEGFSAWALEVQASFAVDGAAALHGNEFVVVQNPATANERLRMNAAHELAHLLFQQFGNETGWTAQTIEKHAYDFAASLLLPHSQLTEAFNGKSFIKLIQYKERFGVSLAAMIHAAEKHRIINTTTSRWLWSEFSRRGWRQVEPGYVWRDRAITFETILESAIQTKALTWREAERITGIREDELQQRVADVTKLGASRAQLTIPDTQVLKLFK